MFNFMRNFQRDPDPVDISSGNGGVATETPAEAPKVETPPASTTREFIHDNETFQLTAAQNDYLLHEGMTRVKNKEQNIETNGPPEAKVEESDDSLEGKVKALQDKIDKQEQQSTFDKNNKQIEAEFTKLFQTNEYTERGTQLMRELTFSLMGRQGLGTTQAFNLVKETLEGFKQEVLSSKEVRSKIIQDYIGGKIEASELTLGETSPGQASGMTDDKPLTMGGLAKGEAGKRLRSRLSKV